jgi:hypothetical protein
MSQESFDPELTDIESALGQLAPVPSRLDRDKLMFEAGAALARPARQRGWVWPSIAATLAVVLASESLVLAVRPGPRVIERVVVVRESAPDGSTSPASDTAVPQLAPAAAKSDTRSSEPKSLEETWLAASDYQRMQELVLRLGLDALPERSSPLVSRLDSTADSVETPIPSAGHLRRLELEKLLNLGPGGPS